MAAYSGTPLPKKLGIKPAGRVALLNASPTLLGDDLPPDVKLRNDLRGSKSFDVIVMLCERRSDLLARFDKAAARLTEAGGLWVGWPKKASGVPTDLTGADVRSFGLDRGLVDNKVCAIDETWSGLRFVVRVKDR
ncbi:MAG: DUF3052 domain-containing protein [Planctomycetota bacterium]